MKKLLFVLIALAPLAALANDCGDGSCWPSTYPSQDGGRTACKDGTVERFIETDATSGNNVYVTRVCHDGAFYRTEGEVRHAGCREGQREVFIESNGGQNDIRVVKVCHNGVFR
jgi:hypothetical protein